MNFNPQGETAILIFANSSNEELKHKPMAHGLDLFDRLTSTTLKTVQKTGLPYFHFTEKEQIGDTFGERFSNAMLAIFNKGFQNVVAIGNDTPTLHSKHILEAHQQLQADKIVIGPSLDGGFYLLGIKKQQFNFQRFKNLPWQTATIKEQLLQATTLKLNSGVIFLQALLDIDTIEDVKKILNYAYTLPIELVKILRVLLQVFQTKITLVCYNVLEGLSSIYFNKGSPKTV